MSQRLAGNPHLLERVVLNFLGWTQDPIFSSSSSLVYQIIYRTFWFVGCSLSGPIFTPTTTFSPEVRDLASTTSPKTPEK